MAYVCSPLTVFFVTMAVVVPLVWRRVGAVPFPSALSSDYTSWTQAHRHHHSRACPKRSPLPDYFHASPAGVVASELALWCALRTRHPERTFHTLKLCPPPPPLESTRPGFPSLLLSHPRPLHLLTLHSPAGSPSALTASFLSPSIAVSATWAGWVSWTPHPRGSSLSPFSGLYSQGISLERPSLSTLCKAGTPLGLTMPFSTHISSSEIPFAYRLPNATTHVPKWQISRTRTFLPTADPVPRR